MGTLTLPARIDTFAGNWRFLSNFYPCAVVLDGETYASVEHAYQAAKFLDPAKRAIFRAEDMRDNPFAAKRLGTMKGLRPDWTPEVRIGVMRALLDQKFTRGSILHRQLLCTFQAELVEGNYWHDTFWGVCSGGCRQPHAMPEGTNQLGKLLMEIRNRSLYTQEK